jgi:hypothetical protein
LPVDPDVGAGNDGGEGNCSTQIACRNGNCSCSGGAHAGQACDATTLSGATSCSILCMSC